MHLLTCSELGYGGKGCYLLLPLKTHRMYGEWVCIWLERFWTPIKWEQVKEYSLIGVSIKQINAYKALWTAYLRFTAKR